MNFLVPLAVMSAGIWIMIIGRDGVAWYFGSGMILLGALVLCGATDPKKP